MDQSRKRDWIAPARAIGFALLAAACTASLPAPSGAPAGLTDHPPAEPTVRPPDAETVEKIAYYQRVQDNYLAQGLLRSDGGGRDTPFSARDLAANFVTIGFFDEFSDRGGKLVAGGKEARLHRWTGDIRVAVEFGPTVPLDQRRSDRADIQAYLSRLSRLTGVPMRLAAGDANFLILIENPAERRGARQRILGFAPGTSRAALNSALELAPAIYCTVFGYSPGRASTYERALAVIRAELPPLMRRACVHEEIAQGLGLINDSPHARPSIFNDDEEFALLTRQDELMLRLLYDPRLRPGMSLAEARPLIETIAAELHPGES